MIIKGKGEGYNKPRTQEEEGTQEPEGGKESTQLRGKETARAGASSSPLGGAPTSCTETPCRDQTLGRSSSPIYPQHLEQSLAPHRCKVDIRLVNEWNPQSSYWLFRWLSTQKFPPPPPSLPLQKVFRQLLGPLGPFQKTNSPTTAPEDPPPTFQSELPLSVLLGKGGTACFARNLHRKWGNLGCFSAFSTSFPKLKKEM